jgi:hypothetical protein
MTCWERLVELYCPHDRRVCNCRQAYETFMSATESGIQRMIDGHWTAVPGWRCKHGCGANQCDAKEIVARGVLKHFGDRDLLTAIAAITPPKNTAGD